MKYLKYDGSNQTLGSVEIKGCTFEIEKGSDCSLYYSNENQIVKLNVFDCTFTGDLDKDAHHIDGQSTEKDKNYLSISDCKFSSDEKRALNIKFININDFNNHVLTNNKLNKKLFSPKLFIDFATLIFAALVILALNMRRRYNDDIDNNFDAQTALDDSLKL